MSLSTHVLDTALGIPAAGIDVTVLRTPVDGPPERIGAGTTDDDGRVSPLVDRDLLPGPHRIAFATAGYLARTAESAFYGDIAIDFVVTDPAAHHHVPLLLSPHGYTTYRGS